MILPQFGQAAQRKLADARVLVVGCGALGSSSAEMLARAGVGDLHLVDRDLVEITNLQRQTLFDESDARDALPKAVAAARRLRAINSSIRVTEHVADVDADTVERFIEDIDVIVDGTDNVETRYLLNDVAVKRAIAWVYGACVGTEGRALAILPGKTACLRCLFPDLPSASELPTCDTAGVLGPAAAVVGAVQASIAMKLLVGGDPPAQEMITFDLWEPRFRSIPVRDAKRDDCPACGMRRFEFLDAPASQATTRLCGRNAVQFRPRTSALSSLDALARKMSNLGEVRQNEHLLRVSPEDSIDLTIFADGRVIVHGTGDVARARSIYARYIGA